MNPPISGEQTRQQTLSWPQALAYLAAALFTLASGATNLVYGLAKGSDPITSAVWCAVSVAASIIFALSWPALIRNLEARRCSAAMMALVALLLAGSYSVTAVLGSAAGGRANQAITESATTDAMQKAQNAYDLAKSELAALKPTKPVAELEALKKSWQERMGKREAWYYEPDLARAKRRAELEQKIERAADNLVKLTPTKQANSDAVALTGYLAAVGITATSDTVNRWLVILAVLLIECGGGLSLAVGLSLSQSGRETMPKVDVSTAQPHQDTPPKPGNVLPAHRTLENREHDHGTPGAQTTGHVAKVIPLKPAPVLAKTQGTPGSTERQNHGAHEGSTDPTGERDTSAETLAGARLLAHLRARGGTLVSSQRDLAEAMRCSRSHANRVLHDLAGAGLVKLATGKSGTVVKLVRQAA